MAGMEITQTLRRTARVLTPGAGGATQSEKRANRARKRYWRSDVHHLCFWRSRKPSQALNEVFKVVMSSTPGWALDFDLLRRRPIPYRWGMVLRKGRLRCSGQRSCSLGLPERVAERSFMIAVEVEVGRVASWDKEKQGGRGGGRPVEVFVDDPI